MSVIQLTDQNFYLAGHRKKTLNINVTGHVLVFFKMPGCAGCKQFEPTFYQLVQNDKRISYAICDIGQNRRIPMMSQQTGNPIKAVPWIFFYSGGTPIAHFKGRKNLPSIQAFIGKALQEVQRRQQMSQQSFVPSTQQGGQYHPQMGGQGYGRGRAMGHPQPPPGQQPRYWKPDMGKAPSMQGIVKGGGNTQYSYLSQVEEEDDTKASLPDQVTPHNMPWGTSYKTLGTMD